VLTTAGVIGEEIREERGMVRGFYTAERIYMLRERAVGNRERRKHDLRTPAAQEEGIWNHALS